MRKKPFGAPKSATALLSSTSIPLKYTMEAMTKKIPVMYPFVRNATDGSCTIVGKISRTANLQVDQSDGKYRNLLKDRLMTNTVTSQRFVKPVTTTESVLNKNRMLTTSSSSSTPAGTAQSDTRKGGTSSSSSVASTAPRSFGNAVLQYGKRKLEVSNAAHADPYRFLLGNTNNDEGEDGGPTSPGGGGGGGGPTAKKSRMFSNDQPLRSVLFALFGKQAYWSVKDAKAAAVAGGATDAGSKKGEAEIREILREIADYHRAGDHKNMWSLRPEFQV